MLGIEPDILDFIFEDNPTPKVWKTGFAPKKKP